MYIVDTYNLLHASDTMGGQVAGMSVRRLCQFISAGPWKVTLVLDGRAKPDEPSANEFPDIALIYSGAGVSADQVIGQQVEKSRSRKQVTVVSNDRAVVLAARRLFAKVMSCEAFLQLLTEKAPRKGGHSSSKPQGKMTSGETDHWMKEFGIAEPPRPVARDDDDDELDIEKLLGPRE